MCAAHSFIYKLDFNKINKQLMILELLRMLHICLSWGGSSFEGSTAVARVCLTILHTGMSQWLWVFH